VDDKREGEEKSYFPDGKTSSVALYMHDQLHGLSQRWNEEGVLIFEGEYKNGLRHGKFNKYFDNGKPHVLQSFVEDQLHGLKKTFDEKGSSTQTKWEKGKKIG
jgi:antitoxin component YwqK of YwqJK toxin-antitoxin module